MVLWILIFTIAIFVIAIFKNNQFVWGVFAVFLGLFLMAFSHYIYIVRLSNVTVTDMYFDYKIFKILNSSGNLSISEVKYISLFGEVCVLAGIYYATGIIGKLSKKCFLFFFVILGFYTFFSMPDVIYEFYIAINSYDKDVAHNAQAIWIKVCNIKVLIVCAIAIFPYVKSTICYRKTKFYVRKKIVLNYVLLFALLEMIYVILVCFNVVNTFMGNEVDVLYNKYIPETFYMGNYIKMIIAIMSVLLLVFVVRIRLSLVGFSPGKMSKLYNTNLVNKSLRMVLHTYKNMFFAIYQLSKFMLLDENLPNDSRQYSKEIYNIAENTLRTITKQIQSFDKLEFCYEEIKYSSIVSKLMNMIPAEDRKKVHIQYCAEEETIYTDEIYFTEILYNVVINAIEATHLIEIPYIEVRFFCEENWHMIEIEDNGCGLSKTEIKHIFKPFVSYKRGKHNWGVGLYYTHRIISAFGGVIYIKSEKDKYTKFEIYLPKHKSVKENSYE